ncbi:hypothetical protein N658DRAFT_466069 [Parathielavia hyrcaniae]|uniref:Uncharacterized protein n=1 Tax=Parathielavia hyrcaniae TaxID=113614 RepID=A0AAN6T4W0_9PEZI|nr:hypothetical protein N658DRAFT_466069 [Parathielavia hyrcaniae]
MGCSESKPTTSSAPGTCIVNEDRCGEEGVCGRVAAGNRRVCAGHLCQYRRNPNERRCGQLPRRLAGRFIYTSAGWYPDHAESAYCNKHKQHNCLAFTSDNVRCYACKTPGKPYCRTHVDVMCRWNAGDGSLCPERIHPMSKYCGGHTW